MDEKPKNTKNTIKRCKVSENVVVDYGLINLDDIENNVKNSVTLVPIRLRKDHGNY